jgi:hypothetical protein
MFAILPERPAGRPGARPSAPSREKELFLLLLWGAGPIALMLKL